MFFKFIALMMGVSFFSVSNAAANYTWHSNTKSAIPMEYDGHVRFATHKHTDNPSSVSPVGKKIQRVKVQMDSQPGNSSWGASLWRQVCWGGTVNCVQVNSNNFYTNAFNGLAADAPIYVRYESRAPGARGYPYFINASVTVEYQ